MKPYPSLLISTGCTAAVPGCTNPSPWKSGQSARTVRPSVLLPPRPMRARERTHLGHGLRPPVQLPRRLACLFSRVQVAAHQSVSRRTNTVVDCSTDGYCHMWYTWCNRPICENQAPTGSTNFRRASIPRRLALIQHIEKCQRHP